MELPYYHLAGRLDATHLASPIRCVLVLLGLSGVRVVCAEIRHFRTIFEQGNLQGNPSVDHVTLRGFCLLGPSGYLLSLFEELALL